jgi:aldehyde:ferredoxin oxidoreductase
MIKNFDLNSIIEIDSLCDDLGLDTISAGVSIAFAMECFERGIITKEDTGGLELRFGNVEAVLPLLRGIAFNHGFGGIVGQGTKRMAEQFGQGSEVFAMHCKGMELGAYDPRAIKGMALVFAVGPRGGCHHAGGFTPIAEVMSGKFDPFSEGKEKAVLVANTRNRRAAGCDSFSMCSFIGMGVTDTTMSELISSVTGIEIPEEEIYVMGERISNIERMFNCREGVRRKNDTLPQRLVSESVPSGPSKGKTVENLDQMLNNYYAHLGWDLKTGVPTTEKLKEMKLDWMINDVR